MHIGKWQAAVGAGTIALSGILAAATPAMGGAAPPTITADQPGAVPAGHNWSYDDFFPRALAVPQGSIIRFSDHGFHTFTLLPHGLSVRADMHANGIAQADGDDTTPNANGTSHAQFNVPGLFPVPSGCGSSTSPCDFDGSQVVSQGNPFGPPTGPASIKASAAVGLYAFHCRIHPGMNGWLRILPSTAPEPTAAHLEQRVKRQVHKDTTQAFAAEAAAHATGVQGSDGHTVWHMWAGAISANGHVAVLEFLPRNLHVRSGDRVIWTVPDSAEVHTVTFPTELFSDLLPSCENGDGTDSPGIPNHVPPQGPGDFHCAGGAPLDEIELGGGNGRHVVHSHSTVVDSGVLVPDRGAVIYGLPDSAARPSYGARFASAPGSYHYLCQIHQGMEADIVVGAP